MTIDVHSVGVFAIAVAACVWDLHSRRIPNALTVSAASVGCVLAFIDGGAAGAARSVAGCVSAMIVFLPFFALGGMGAGDVKLLGALGAWLGAPDSLRLALYTAVAGGVMALLVALSRSYVTAALGNVWRLLAYWFKAGLRPHPDFTITTGSSPRLAYAIPIGVGALTTLWLH